MALVVVLLLLFVTVGALMLHGQSLIRGRAQTLERLVERLEAGLAALAQQAEALERRLTALEPSSGTQGGDPLDAEPVPEAEAPLDPIPPPAPGAQQPKAPGASAPPPPLIRRRLAQAPRHTPPTPFPTALPSPPPPLRWSRGIGQKFIENWTGILGVVVVVAGVTFLVINLALRLPAFERFLLTVAAAMALVAPSVLLGRRPTWRRLTSWMRSGGAALFLFACAASGGFPALGLQWLFDPWQALALLSLGVVPNLALAGLARSQTMASLHVLLALVPLMVVVQTQRYLAGETLAIASLVALVGLLLPLRHPWDRHRLLVSWSYGLFHGAWFLHCAAGLQANGDLRLGAAGAAVVVFGSGVLLGHRRYRAGGAWEAPRPIALPLALQLTNWGALGLALLVYPQQAAGRAAALALAALLAVLLARSARTAKVRWLHLSDTLVAQALAMAVVLSLAPLIANSLLLVFTLLVETLLFLRVGVAENDSTIRGVGWALLNLLGLALVLAGLAAGGVPAGADLPFQNVVVLVVAALLTTWVQLLLSRRAISLPLASLPGWWAGALMVTAAMVCAPEPARETVALIGLGVQLLVARRWRPPGLMGGSAMAVLLVHLVAWGAMVASGPWQPLALLAHLVPLTLLSLLTTVAAGSAWGRPLGIDLLGINAGLGAYLLFEPVSPLIPGVVWLLLSLLALVASDRLHRNDVTHVLVLGLLYLLAFAGAFVVVISDSPALVGAGPIIVPIRLWIELFALAVVLFWWFFSPREGLRAHPLWRRVHPLFPEAALVGGLVVALNEVGDLALPVAWSLLALALISPPCRRWFPPRLALYGVLLYWIAIASGVAMVASRVAPSPRWFEQPQALGLVAIGLQTLFIVASHRWLDPQDLCNPGGLSLLGWLGRRIAARRNPWLYYPLFAAVAYVLFLRYDHSLLTLFWAAEAFTVFLLGVLLREKGFRTLALVGLGAVQLRLVAIDMAQSDLGIRGLVFIGVGLLMLGMNAIESRFRRRFD